MQASPGPTVKTFSAAFLKICIRPRHLTPMYLRCQSASHFHFDGFLPCQSLRQPLNLALL
jgi:hypothetical protein